MDRRLGQQAAGQVSGPWMLTSGGHGEMPAMRVLPWQSGQLLGGAWAGSQSGLQEEQED